MRELNKGGQDNRYAGIRQRPTVPWVSHETQALASVADGVKNALLRLDKKTSRGRIHDARTALKRWNAVWSVLGNDGWTFDDDVTDDLKKLFKSLGDARDYDVNLKRAEELNVSGGLVEQWKSSRKKARKQLESRLKRIDVVQVCNALDKLMKHQPSVVSLHMAHSAAAEESSNDHIGFVLQQQEKRVYKTALAPATAEDYHGLRKEVKNWGYLLQELTHTENEQIKEVEQRLGDLHDLDKLEPLLVGDEANLTALGNLLAKREQLLSSLENLTQQLPFGYRPWTAKAA
jgi:CHAD domain-containing protein